MMVTKLPMHADVQGQEHGLVRVDGVTSPAGTSAQDVLQGKLSTADIQRYLLFLFVLLLAGGVTAQEAANKLRVSLGIEKNGGMQNFSVHGGGIMGGVRTMYPSSLDTYIGTFAGFEAGVTGKKADPWGRQHMEKFILALDAGGDIPLGKLLNESDNPLLQKIRIGLQGRVGAGWDVRNGNGEGMPHVIGGPTLAREIAEGTRIQAYAALWLDPTAKKFGPNDGPWGNQWGIKLTGDIPNGKSVNQGEHQKNNPYRSRNGNRNK